MSAPGQPSKDVYDESAEVHERNLRIGVRIIAGSTIMFFFSFAFAYFYLRSLDARGLWRPDGVDPPAAYGVAILVLFVLAAAAIGYAARATRQRRPWKAPAGLALALGLVGCVVQAFEYAHLGFGPTSGGYASVFYGWTTLFVVFALSATYWVEALVAEGVRDRHYMGAEVPAGIEEAAFYWRLLAAIAVIAWVLLYVTM
jgi:heme/copper-type cytochrome/quinol oxidase subunit 3